MFRVSLRKSINFIIIVIFFSFLATAIAQQPTTYKILGISVEGNKTADPATIILNSGFKVGDEIQIP